MRFNILFIILFLLSSLSLRGQDSEMKLVESRLIWSKSHHNAFTSLAVNNGVFYSAFRESQSHKDYKGGIRVIYSTDTFKWESLSLLKIKGEDLRDPSLIVVNDELFLMFVSRTKTEHFSYTYKYNPTLKYWQFVDRTVGTWRWGFTVEKGIVYSTAYSSKDKEGTIYSLDPKRLWLKWRVVQTNVFPEMKAKPNEAAILFNSENTYIILRQGAGTQTTLLGVKSNTDSNWVWHDLHLRLESPEGMFINDNQILTVVRSFSSKIETIVGIIDLDANKFSKALTLPSRGDTGYASIIRHNNKFYVSYYSTMPKKNKTGVYLAELEL